MRTVIKRIYERSSPSDGYRILIDRLWPRSVKKEEAAVDLWFKDIAPSTNLRKWFNHEPQKFEEFETRYRKELDHSKSLEELIRILNRHDHISLLIAAKDALHNHGLILQKILEEHFT